MMPYRQIEALFGQLEYMGYVLTQLKHQALIYWSLSLKILVYKMIQSEILWKFTGIQFPLCQSLICIQQILYFPLSAGEVLKCKFLRRPSKLKKKSAVIIPKDMNAHNWYSR